MGALGGARATLTRNDALARAVRVTGVPVFRTWQSLQRGGTLAALPHRAQSSVRVNATLSTIPYSPPVFISVHVGITEPTVRCVVYIHSFPHGRKNRVQGERE